MHRSQTMRVYGGDWELDPKSIQLAQHKIGKLRTFQGDAGVNAEAERLLDAIHELAGVCDQDPVRMHEAGGPELFDALAMLWVAGYRHIPAR